MTTQDGSAGQATNGNKSDTVRQTIFETIEAPRLTDIKTEHFVMFLVQFRTATTPPR